MANIIISTRKNAIEITKDFQKRASIFGSEEYNQLKAAKADFPTYRVCVKAAPKRKFEDYITMQDILYYVENHSGKDSKEMKELEELRGTSFKDAGNVFEMEEAASFAIIKKWFFNTYSELANKTDSRKNRINQIIANAEAKAKAAAEANAAAEVATAAEIVTDSVSA